LHLGDIEENDYNGAIYDKPEKQDETINNTTDNLYND